jgi:hypothetical protein
MPLGSFEIGLDPIIDDTTIGVELDEQEAARRTVFPSLVSDHEPVHPHVFMSIVAKPRTEVLSTTPQVGEGP